MMHPRPVVPKNTSVVHSGNYLQFGINMHGFVVALPDMVMAKLFGSNKNVMHTLHAKIAVYCQNLKNIIFVP